MVASNFPSRPFRLEGGSWLISQSISANNSRVGGDLWIRKNSYSPTYSLDANSSFTFHINGAQVGGWSFSFDFRNSDALRLIYAEATVGHNADGSKSYSFDGYANVKILGYTEIHGATGLPTIPRASTATWAVPGNAVAGVAKTLNTNRASSAFTHDIDYYFGSVTGRALTGVGASGAWTPPLSLLNQIPNAAVGYGNLRTHTYNGGSMIGWTQSSFALEAGPEIVPTWTGATVAHKTGDIFQNQIVSVIGAGKYLQGLSQINVAITGAAGVYGSTIASYSQKAGTATTGPTPSFSPAEITTASGSISSFSTGTVPVVQKITDTRGRVKTLTTNISVLPYSLPVVSSVKVERCDVNGVLDPQGTYVKVTLVGAVQSIMNGTEKNQLGISVEWAAPGESNGSASMLALQNTLAGTFTGVVAGPFSVLKAYDVSVLLFDKLGYTYTRVTKKVGTGEIYQHWGTGLGIGKYWEKGMVDVLGDVYASGGALSLGKRISNANTAVHEGRYHMNGGTGVPPVRPNGVTTGNGQIVIDVDTWYEVQGTTTFHYVRQRARWISSRASNDSRRNIRTSLGGGYAMSRYSSNGGSSWSEWFSDDPFMGVATATGGLSAQDPITGRYNFLTTTRNVVLDGVFLSDVTCYRVDYYYRTSDNQDNYIRLRSAGTYPTGLTYTTQATYVSGTGTPAAVADNNATQIKMGRNGTQVHWGYIYFYNLANDGMVKTWSGRENGASAVSNVDYGGHLGGTGADNTTYDGILLSTFTSGAFWTHGWIRVTAVF